ncbi:MAG: YeeE/YedE thiosulfate transporter family protein [Rhodospirillales bacterium]|jgi:uncharacterized protein|nr:YeeE/YedE thiosulfate transporter family protein [Rhodospirillales bacterium]
MVFNAHDILMGLGGGMLIGCGAALFLLFAGRIAGISGIASAVARIEPGTHYKGSVLFLLGLIVAPQIYGLFHPMPDIGVTHSVVLLSAGGLLVGFGSRTGGGCTSGHGVCGLSRFSPRSIAATLVFMSIAMAVAVFVRPMIYG